MHLIGVPKRVVDASEFIFDPEKADGIGLSADLLADLYDLVQRFGIRTSPYADVRTAFADPAHQLYVLTSNSETDLRALTICRIPEINLLREDDLLVSLFHSDEPTGIVSWSKNVPIKDVRSCIRTVDGKMFDQGFVDKRTYERIPITAPSVKGRLCVEDIFIWPERRMWIQPSISPVRPLLQRFDRPADLEYVSTDDDAGFICRRRDVKRIELRRKVKRKARDAVLFRHGLTNEDLHNLPSKKMMRIEREISKETLKALQSVSLGPDPPG